MLQEYEIPGEMRRFHTELPVSSYGRFRGKVYGRGKYRDLEVCIRLGDENEYGVDHIDGKEYRTPFPHVVLKSPGLVHSFRSAGEREVCFSIIRRRA